MPIPADLFVSVNPMVLNPGGRSLVFNGLLLTKNATIPLQTGVAGTANVPGILQFGSAPAVGQYFGMLSDEYRYAQGYFKGYDGSTRKPQLLYTGRVVDTDALPWVRGGAVKQMSVFAGTGMDAATFTMSVDGTPLSITPVNVTLATSFSEVASILQAALEQAGEDATPPLADASAITVTYSSDSNAFTITGGTAGAGHSLTAISGTLANAMLLTNPIYSVGADAETADATMERLTQSTSNWVTFAPLWKAAIDEAMAFGQWTQQYPVRFAFLPWNDDAVNRIASDTTDMKTALSDLGLEGICCLDYPDYMLSAFVSGAAGSVNYQTPQGAITYAYKKQAGLAFNVNDRNEAIALRDKGWNFYGNAATANDRFIFFYQGTLTGTEWPFLDTFLNAVWLNSELQLAGMTLLTSHPRIQYNEDGYTATRLGLMGPINRAAGRQGNGVIDTGVTLTDDQRAVVIQQAGEDITRDLYMYGFFLLVRDPAPEQRAQRLSPNIWLWYTYGGAIHKLDIASVAIT